MVARGETVSALVVVVRQLALTRSARPPAGLQPVAVRVSVKGSSTPAAVSCQRASRQSTRPWSITTSVRERVSQTVLSQGGNSQAIRSSRTLAMAASALAGEADFSQESHESVGQAHLMVSLSVLPQ